MIITKKTAIGFFIMALVALGLTPMTFQAHAEDAIATELSVSDLGSGYLGAWDLTFSVEALGSDISMVLTIVDVDGKVGATLDSRNQPEPLAINSIEIVDNHIDMNSELTFGGSFTIDININAILEGDELVGAIKDAGGLLSADFRIKQLSQEELDSVQGRRPQGTEARLNIGGKRVRIAFASLKVGNSDWDLFQNLKEGQVYKFTLSRATKMYTEFDLHFGDVVVVKENITKDYPGVYSLWLRKTSDGWNLIFNSQPDIWGTSYLPEHDAAEIPLTVSKAAEHSEKFVVTIDEEGDGHTLGITWGDTQWNASFKVAQ